MTTKLEQFLEHPRNGYDSVPKWLSNSTFTKEECIDILNYAIDNNHIVALRKKGPYSVNNGRIPLKVIGDDIFHASKLGNNPILIVQDNIKDMQYVGLTSGIANEQIKKRALEVMESLRQRKESVDVTGIKMDLNQIKAVVENIRNEGKHFCFLKMYPTSNDKNKYISAVLPRLLIKVRSNGIICCNIGKQVDIYEIPFSEICAIRGLKQTVNEKDIEKIKAYHEKEDIENVLFTKTHHKVIPGKEDEFKIILEQLRKILE